LPEFRTMLVTTMRFVRSKGSYCTLVLFGAVVAAGLTLAVAASASADPIEDPTTLHLQCVGETLPCPTVSGILMTADTNPTFTITQSGALVPGWYSGNVNAWLAVLWPNGGGPSSFNVASNFLSGSAALSLDPFNSGDLWTLLGLTDGTASPNFSAYRDKSLAASGSAPGSYSVYTFMLRGGFSSWDNIGPISFSFAAPFSEFPLGTIFQAYLTNAQPATRPSKGSFLADELVLNSSPLSESLAVTPEPASMALLGTGLLGVLAAGLRRRRRAHQAFRALPQGSLG
jgi:hypothetical protein